MKIKAIFDSISSEPSTNKKMEILASHKGMPYEALLKRVLYLANSPRVKFYIKHIPEFIKNGSNISLDMALDQLEVLKKRTVTGHAAIDHLKNILSSVDEEDAEVIVRIIDKDCMIGMGTTNITKVFGEFIETTPYMGAKAYKRELAEAIFADPANKGYAYSQVKMDGRYVNVIISDGTALLESRAGELTILDGSKFVKELMKFEDCVLNGELTIDGVSRYDSNGIIASLVSIGGKILEGEDVIDEIKKFEKKKGITYQSALNSIRLTVWDTISLVEYTDAKSSVPYHDRLINLSNLIKKAQPTMISFIDTKKVYKFEDAMVHFQKNLSDGKEGTILKASMGGWKDDKPNWQVKMKLEMDVDLEIVGFNYGTGKNIELISSVNAKSSDGLVFTRPTGIKEDDMKYITENQSSLLGSIVEVKCSGLSQDSSGNYSLLHPVFKCIRTDKKTCDSLQQIKDIESAAKSIPKQTKSTDPLDMIE